LPSGSATNATRSPPGHVRRLADDRGARRAQVPDPRVDVIDVDEELVARAGSGLDAGEHPRRLLGRHRELGAVAAQPDEADRAVGPVRRACSSKPRLA
jgi:hypothetical protein